MSEQTTLFNSKKEFFTFVDKWRHFVSTGEKLKCDGKGYGWLGITTYPQSEHHLFYSLARGKEATEGFVKESRGLMNAIYKLQTLKVESLEPIFGESVSADFLDRIKEKLKNITLA